MKTILQWLRLRPRWHRDVAVLTLGVVVIITAVAWASRQAVPTFTPSAPAIVAASADASGLPAVLKWVIFGAGAGFGAGGLVMGLRMGARSASRAASTVSGDLQALFLKFTQLETTQETMSAQLTKIDGALSEYNGFGGLLPRLQAVEAELRTVDPRITQSRHDVVKQLSGKYTEDAARADDKWQAQLESLRHELRASQGGSE